MCIRDSHQRAGLEHSGHCVDPFKFRAPNALGIFGQAPDKTGLLEIERLGIMLGPGQLHFFELILVRRGQHKKLFLLFRGAARINAQLDGGNGLGARQVAGIKLEIGARCIAAKVYGIAFRRLSDIQRI